MAGFTKNFRIESNDELGRYLVADVDLKPGDVIFEDTPIVVGPKTKSEPVCLNCNAGIVGKFVCCTRCKIAPMCSNDCGNNIARHTAAECNLMAELRGKLTLPVLIDDMNVVTIMRCLLLRSTEDWPSLISMESHCEARKGLPIWTLRQRTVNVLKQIEMISDDEESTALVQKLCGIIDVNGFELRLPSSSNVDSMVGLYPTAVLMAHSCVSNTHLSVDDDFKMIVRASVPISKDSIIYFNYTNVLYGTLKRREHLRHGKYFVCKCVRCLDPTEMGTHMSSIMCGKCGGIATMGCDSNPNSWRCGQCKNEYTPADVNNVLKQILEYYGRIDPENLEALEDCLRFMKAKLHPNHYLAVEIKQIMAGYLKTASESFVVTDRMLRKQIEICSGFIPILNALEPGLSRLKGIQSKDMYDDLPDVITAIALYELYVPIVRLANNEYGAKRITKDVFTEKLDEACNCLKEAVRMLLYEPESTPEGRLCRRALDELKTLQKTRKNIN